MKKDPWKSVVDWNPSNDPCRGFDPLCNRVSQRRQNPYTGHSMGGSVDHQFISEEEGKH